MRNNNGEKSLYLLGTIGSFGMAMMTALLIPSMISVIPAFLMLVPTDLFLARYIAARGQLIEDTIFQVHKGRKGKLKICQNVLSNPEKIMDFSRIKDPKGKINKIEDEAITTFTNLKQKDRRGIKITYVTKSQGITKACLTRAEKHGYIENLEVKPKGKKRMIIEKLTIGNYKNLEELFAKTNVYEFSFQLTDKPRNMKEIKQLIKR